MKAIVAMDLKRVIGNKGQIPWRIPDDMDWFLSDMRWFKKLTMGMPYQEALKNPESNKVFLQPLAGYLVMGNSTFKEVGPLPHRFTFVLTNNVEKLRLPFTHKYGYVTGNFLKEKIFPTPWNNIWVCGGAKTYESLLPDCDEIFVTLVLDEYEGDCFMCPFEHIFPNSEILKENKNYWILRYWK